MKTNHYQLSTALFTVTTLVFLASAIAHADYIYVSCYGNGTIEKFDSSGNGTIFASGLNGPSGLAFDSSGNLFTTNWSTGTIEKFDSSGNRSVFASGLNRPSFIAAQIPEPATLLLLGLGGLIIRRLKFKKRVRILNVG